MNAVERLVGLFAPVVTAVEGVVQVWMDDGSTTLGIDGLVIL